MKRARFLERGGAVVMAAALAMGAPAAALADAGPGGGGPGGGGECVALQVLVQAHPGWAVAFPTLEARLQDCGLVGPAGPGARPGDQKKPKAPPAPPGPVQFQDLGGYGWARADVTLLAELGIIRGEGDDMFGPGQQITRVQFAELMQRMFNLPEPASTVSFVDVTPSTPGYGAIEAAAPYMTEFNTLGGVAFEPNLPEVRIEVAATIGEVEVAEHVATLPSTTTAAQIWSQFSDGTMVPPGLLQASAIAVEQGFMKGYPDGSFGVDNPLTRAQAAVLLARLLESSETIGSGSTTTTTSTSAPAVTGIQPASGPAAGGTTVTITGSGFVQGATVLFGATASQSVTYVSSSELLAVSPPGSGTVDVLVAETSGTSPASSADQFTYTAAAPQVTGISPSTGPTTGGTAVTITGSGFASDATVIFGSTPATSVTFVNSGEIQAVAPASSAAGSVNVLVAQPSGTSAVSSADVFTYTAPSSATLSVTGISPASGPAGTQVLISGTGFASGATVDFGSNAATGVDVYNTTTMTAQAPAGSGTVAVTVYENGSSATSSNAFFTYS